MDMTAAKEAVMKSARHLNAYRMAWVANRWTPGYDWRGCSKGYIAGALVAGIRHSPPRPITQDELSNLCSRMRTQRNANGRAALIAEEPTEPSRGEKPGRKNLMTATKFSPIKIVTRTKKSELVTAVGDAMAALVDVVGTESPSFAATMTDVFGQDSGNVVLTKLPKKRVADAYEKLCVAIAKAKGNVFTGSPIPTYEERVAERRQTGDNDI